MKSIIIVFLLFLFGCLQSQSNLTPLDRALSKSTAFFQAKNGHLEPLYLDIFLHYFQLKYKIDLNVNMDTIKYLMHTVQADYNTGPFYARLIGEATFTTSEKQIDSLCQPYDSLMLRALYYDKLVIDPQTIIALLKYRYQVNDPYSMSHGLFALAWLKELHFKPSITNKYIHKFSNKSAYMLNHNICSNLDEYVENASMLSYHKKKYKHYKKWQYKIIELQNNEGAWGIDLKNISNSVEHTSILAYWFLLNTKYFSTNSSYDWIRLTE